MSSRQFEKLLHLKIINSRTLAVVLIVLHIAAFASVLFSIGANQIIFWFLISLIALSFVYYFQKTVLLTHPLSIVRVTQTRQGDWSLHMYNGEIIDADLCDDSYKHPLLVILNFKTNLGRLSTALFPDALENDLHRQLRSRLTLSRPVEREKLLRR